MSVTVCHSLFICMVERRSDNRTMHILAVVCALVFGAQSPAPSSPPSGAALAGTWTLNKEQSDSPRNRADDGRDGDREAGRRGGYGGGRGGFGGRGGYGGRGMGRGGDRSPGSG
jgi:hypothetical protein